MTEHSLFLQFAAQCKEHADRFSELYLRFQNEDFLHIEISFRLLTTKARLSAKRAKALSDINPDDREPVEETDAAVEAVTAHSTGCKDCD